MNNQIRKFVCIKAIIDGIEGLLNEGKWAYARAL